MNVKDNPKEIEERVAMVREESLARHVAKGNNPETIAASRRAYYLENRTQIREQQRSYKARRKGKIKATQAGDN